METKDFSERSIYELGETGALVNILNKLGVKECDKVADRLLERFGSFNGVFAATHEEIMKLGCVTERVASFLVFVRPMFRQALLRRATCKLDSERALIRYVTAYFILNDLPSSAWYCIYTNNRTPLYTEQLTSDNLVREAIGKACRYYADGVIIIRYRPNGQSMRPNKSELSTVKEIAATCELAEKEFIDYIEFTPYKFYSYKRASAGDDGVMDILDAGN